MNYVYVHETLLYLESSSVRNTEIGVTAWPFNAQPLNYKPSMLFDSLIGKALCGCKYKICPACCKQSILVGNSYSFCLKSFADTALRFSG